MRMPCLVALLVPSLCANGAAATFVYTNNDNPDANYVAGYLVSPAGALSPLPGSPFATGGNGSGGGLFASNRIRTAIVRNKLYASNSGSHNITAFSINPVSGALTVVQGSPFAVAGSTSDLSLAITPDGKYLYAGDAGLSQIYGFSIVEGGGLAPIAGFPIAAPGVPDSLSITPVDGKFLAVALIGANKVAMYFINPGTGALSPVVGSPFKAPASIGGGVAGLDFNCAQNRLFAGMATAGPATVAVYKIDSMGALSQIDGSPFTGPGLGSSVVALSPDDSKLFVSNSASTSVDLFTVGSNGALSVLASSRFSIGVEAVIPSGVATDVDGKWLFVASNGNKISVFTIGSGPALSAVAGSPFANTPGVPNLQSLAVFPAKNCCPAPVISHASASPNALSPPNHKFVPVTIDYSLLEPCPSTCVLTVSSTGKPNGAGDKNGSPDWEVIDAHHLMLRAERSGDGDGRVYTITIKCTNNTNRLSSSQVITVVVPKG
jgi:6-phosphogluconolactonase (cycloisomerase 2 family)